MLNIAKSQSQTITHSMDLQVVPAKLTFAYFSPAVANGKHVHWISILPLGRGEETNSTKRIHQDAGSEIGLKRRSVGSASN